MNHGFYYLCKHDERPQKLSKRIFRNISYRFGIRLSPKSRNETPQKVTGRSGVCSPPKRATEPWVGTNSGNIERTHVGKRVDPQGRRPRVSNTAARTPPRQSRSTTRRAIENSSDVTGKQSTSKGTGGFQQRGAAGGLGVGPTRHAASLKTRARARPHGRTKPGGWRRRAGGPTSADRTPVLAFW